MEATTSRDDIRKLLKAFGVRADELIVAHLARLGPGGPLRLRLTLEDLTEYGSEAPPQPLGFELEGPVRR